MRILTFFAALVGTILFAVEFWHVTSVGWIAETGLANPTLRIDVMPDAKPRLVIAFVVMFVTWYVWLVVAWVDRRMAKISASQAQASEPEANGMRPLQPLKDAIRRGDFDAAYRYVRSVGRLPREDEDRLSAEELAEIYGREEILELLRSVDRQLR